MPKAHDILFDQVLCQFLWRYYGRLSSFSVGLLVEHGHLVAILADHAWVLEHLIVAVDPRVFV